jgi:CRISPR associated protein Cas1
VRFTASHAPQATRWCGRLGSVRTAAFYRPRTRISGASPGHSTGLDLFVGLMHTDTRYRGSLATDLMEPTRPIVDRLVLYLLAGREFQRGKVAETRDGICRLGPGLARKFASGGAEVRMLMITHATVVRDELLSATKRRLLAHATC